MASNYDILIVDDDIQLGISLCNILTLKGYTPVAVETGKEALKQIDAGAPDVALIDLKLEDMSGLDLIRKIRELCPATECILITGYSSKESAVDAVNIGAYGYMTKPYDIEQLVLMIRRAIDRHESVGKFRAISETANDAIIMINNDNCISYWNKAAERLFGFSTEEIIGKKIHETIVPEKFRKDHLGGFNKFSDTGQGHYIGKTVELFALRKDGTEFPMELSLSAVKMGNKWNAMGIVRDITERKKMVERLKDSEEKIRTWLECSPVCTKIVDIDFNLQYMSAAGIKALKIDDVTKLYGKPYPLDFFPEVSKKSMTRNLVKAKEADEIITGEDPICDIDGNELWFQYTLVPVKDDEDRTNYFIIVSIDIAERKQAEQQIKKGIEDLRMTLDGVIHALAITVEQRDPYTAGHQRRVSQLACAIADEMGLPGDQIEGLKMAGIVHDIGKMHIPTEILSRPGKLTKDEFNIVKTHAQVGYDILKGIEFPWPIADIVHQHHEYMDGSGYPLGLSNGDILMEARILCVADVVEAMASHRPYRPALGMDMALEEISKEKGICFDVRVVLACLKIIKEKGFAFE